MIREEIEIRDAIDTIFPISPSGNGRTYEQALMTSGFEEGIKWADNNPKSPWISVNDDLPCNHEELFINDDKKETKTVLSIINGYIMMSRMYKPKRKWRWDSEEQPTYWMPIPELPKE